MSSARRGKQGTEQAVIEFLTTQGEATVDEVAAGVGIGRTSTRKYLAGLTAEDKVVRIPGGREGRRRPPDRFAPANGSEKPSASKPPKGSTRRLRPGELDALVLAYLRKHSKELPLTASAVAKGIDRSSGAVANCLGRLAKQKKARQANPKPRAYDLGTAK